jgi:isoleucyl-tRNA synthetase
LTDAGHGGESLLVWTTTPWTLSSNVAAAVHPDLVYQLVATADGERWWLSGGSRERVAPGLEVVAEARGADLVGLHYEGPFDELPVQAGVERRVIPWTDVDDAEGTGVVHIAPGCGEEDFALAKVNDLAVLDPIDESGIFKPGYGWQSGRFAGAGDEGSTLATEIADDLAAKGRLVSHEIYRHHYPVCWRCGTQLLFRLVDEWFIAMDPLRDEISAVTRTVRWLPEVGLEERELDWLRNMRDWMISKKRYYGLALPIWACTECDAWEVIGSPDELRERATAGWEAFEGHSPHRPWIDGVEIACAACGGVARRIADVGNPWLDAGIVGYSTLEWASDPAYWERWFPADFITESFPGQFRNWFYALLTMSTVMSNQAPMKTLLGHALVRDEHGEEMHKSKGNAIWFDDAAEEMGADVMRWMYAGANPAVNLQFGPHHAAEVVRSFLLPLWNSYSFFVTYANLDGWQPSDDRSGDRTVNDRWILSRLDGTTAEVRDALDNYDAAAATKAIETLVDDLSNWYIRRNRRRFWKGELDADKRAAYDTLHEVLTTTACLTAPFIPHLADAMWGNLVAADSVHLADYPTGVDGRREPALEAAINLARRIVAGGRTARAASGIRTRQPLRLARIKLPVEARGALASDPALAGEIAGQIRDELNVRALEFISDESDLVERTLYPLLPVIGPRHGAEVGTIMAAVRSGDWSLTADGGALVGGVALAADAFELTARPRPGQEVAADGDLLVALDTAIDEGLLAEGHVREVAHHLQNLRKEAGLDIADRIVASIDGPSSLLAMLRPHADWLASEILADRLEIGSEPEAASGVTRGTVALGDASLQLALTRSE